MRRVALLVAAVLVVGTLFGAFLRTGSDRAEGSSRAPVIEVAVKDFHIEIPAVLPAGDAVLRVHNAGPDDHELILVRSGGELPVRADGITVDEDALEASIAGILEPGAPGSTRDLHVHLVPGRYEVLCNMAGHLLGGMRVSVSVVA
jgi:hypothetical protein